MGCLVVRTRRPVRPAAPSATMAPEVGFWRQDRTIQLRKKNRKSHRKIRCQTTTGGRTTNGRQVNNRRALHIATTRHGLGSMRRKGASQGRSLLRRQIMAIRDLPRSVFDPRKMAALLFDLQRQATLNSSDSGSRDQKRTLAEVRVDRLP